MDIYFLMYWSAKVTPGSKQKMYLMQGRQHRAKWNSAVLIIKCNFSRSLLREIRNQGRGDQKSAILANSLFEWLFTPPLLFASYCPQNIPSTLCPNGRPPSKEYFVQVWSHRSKGLWIYLSFFLILRLFSKWLVSILSTFWMVIYFEKKRVLGYGLYMVFDPPMKLFNWHENIWKVLMFNFCWQWK